MFGIAEPMPKRLRHLEGAMRLTGPRGMCFHRSVALVLDVPGAELCFGTFRAATDDEARAIGPLASRRPFIHCWVEYKGLAWAPSLIDTMGGLKPMRPDEYYKVNGASNIVVMRRPAVLALSRRHGFISHLRYGKELRPGVSFGTVLLEAAGIEWEVTPEGGVIPKTKGVS